MNRLIIGAIVLLSVTACQQDWRDCKTQCAAEPQVGECEAAIPKYYFDQDAGACREFTWGGCGGVVPFETLEACEACACFE